MTPTMTRTRLFGEYLREISGLSREQIVEGLRAQVVARDSGKNLRLGEILVARGAATRQQVDLALLRQLEDRQQ